MNAAFFLTPKQEVASLFDNHTVRQGLEKMRHHGYSALPVTTKENKYIGIISEGDFLWYLLDADGGNLDPEKRKKIEKTRIRDIMSQEQLPPVKITVSMEELLERVLNQNFVPVVDDTNSFIGIVTRKGVIRYFSKNQQHQMRIG